MTEDRLQKTEDLGIEVLQFGIRQIENETPKSGRATLNLEFMNSDFYERLENGKNTMVSESRAVRFGHR